MNQKLCSALVGYLNFWLTFELGPCTQLVLAANGNIVHFWPVDLAVCCVYGHLLLSPSWHLKRKKIFARPPFFFILLSV